MSDKTIDLILKPVTIIPVSAVWHFVARESLTVANVGWTGENFKRLFFDKVEENVPAGRIAVQTLVKGSLDFEIEAALGRARRVVRLAHFFQLLKKQAKGQAGPLLTSGAANLAYDICNDRNVWAVDADWVSVGRYWYVEASSVGHPNEWSAGSRVLSQAV